MRTDATVDPSAEFAEYRARQVVRPLFLCGDALGVMGSLPAQSLDPFCGTGTTNLVAFQLGRMSVGIDISPDYIADAEERCRLLL